MEGEKKEAASGEATSLMYVPYFRTVKIGSPNGIRTRVLTLRGLRPRPLVDGAIACWLGNLDSNQDYLIQSQASCHWTIPQLCSSETLTYDKGGFRYCQGGITPIKSFALF